ncbi:hypothetical protein IGI04_002142 [Brassica rapa subsp. trilocularis]|uniref:Uncharacterized protein n=1 Tax=Brassica rapa subsp. trilocularis TaxID=1813537 RepID=A0ABQ7NUN4_BRACM|nr:hypothetical protein IGI04_002142 [Brassica rapa subsp. trilocularis]
MDVDVDVDSSKTNSNSEDSKSEKEKGKRNLYVGSQALNYRKDHMEILEIGKLRMYFTLEDTFIIVIVQKRKGKRNLQSYSY